MKKKSLPSELSPHYTALFGKSLQKWRKAFANILK